MIIDFHTHIFPDTIAKKTISKLGSMIAQHPYTDATADGLLRSMKEAGVDYSVVLPVVTRPAQFQTVNAFAAEVTKRKGIISFGGLHPKTADYKAELDYIAELGLKGIKLHPDFQDTFIDECCYIDLITYALEKKLIVSIHAGKDEGLPEVVHCPPKRALIMIQEVQKRASTDKLILAHTGGFAMWDAVEKYLAGQNLYMDISFSRKEISKEQMVRIIQNHGADRILFGSDSPWDGQKETLEYVRSLGITEEEKKCILGENAKTLLDLS
ncbi:amidohydrolase family protein [[Clostridium] polysaccharolyticum]|jgi:hypothetical protein|uniref:Amidohydrolase-related domain-containing protein n=1 Tax=[Clostridium] polysaccharolyticum TaxID=29364 RepID=A0A1H9ZAM1_9FIRM|nr:amidohydrolase family protein [[Clostridium] polysaccharolyticum]SES78595.1 hypothetical protein SAMN04487772_10398 [[Clostridium] polysaccharolyticum]